MNIKKVSECTALMNKRTAWCHLLFYFISYVVNMFRTLIYPSSGTCDHYVELPHWSCVLVSMCVGDSVCLVLVGEVSVLQAEAQLHPTTRIPLQRNDTETPTQSKQEHTTNVVIQQNIRQLLMMDMLISETCWAHKKWNKIASIMNLVFYSSTITMMHGPINIKCVAFLVQ